MQVCITCQKFCPQGTFVININGIYFISCTSNYEFDLVQASKCIITLYMDEESGE